jgi:flagellar biosynthetic protein FlhB
MAGDDVGDRTEEPTDRKRSEAREKGNVARSTDLNAAGLMLAAAAAIYFFGLSMTRSMAEFMHSNLSRPFLTSIDPPTAIQLSTNVADFLGATVLPLMLMMAGSALALNLLQVGFMLNTESLQPKMSRINPLEGVKRIVSIRALVKLGVSLGKLIVLISIAVWFISSAVPELLHTLDVEWMPTDATTAGNSFRETRFAALFLVSLRDLLGSLAFQLAAALVILALIDFAFQKWKHEQDLKMTKQEIRDEMKNMEGDPLIRQRRGDAHRKIAQARELNEVRDADVVITNPTHIAVALIYDPDKTPAPKVVAKGKGEIAMRIRQIAAEHSVTIIERKPLARALYANVKVGHIIPVEMYEVFVEIMAYVYRLTGRVAPPVE